VAWNGDLVEAEGRPNLKQILITSALFLVLAVPVKPQTSTAAQDQTSGTGIELARTCGIPTPQTEVKDAIQETYCIGLVHGVFAVMTETGRLHIATFVSNAQMVLVVKKYLDEHPERLGERDTILVVDALAAAFPPTEENRKRLSSPACQPILK
jgi:hypothetical protein